MKNVKMVTTFTVSDEFYASSAYQDVKASILSGEQAKEMEMEGEVWNMNITMEETEV